MEDNADIRKRVAVFPNITLKIFFDDRVMPFSQFKIGSIEEFSNLLKSVDDIEIDKMYM